MRKVVQAAIHRIYQGGGCEMNEFRKTNTYDVKLVYQMLYQILGEKYGFNIIVTNVKQRNN